MNKIERIYHKLRELYGPQGWWPLSSKNGYHKNDYTLPNTDDQRFEICIGAILTQNTNFKNVEKALINLNQKKLLSPKTILESKEKTIKEAIKPSGYFNQKYKKIINFCIFYNSLQGKTPARDDLLNIWGIGPETADSILLYAYKVPTFVVDTYTKRVFSNLGIIDKEDSYKKVKEIFEKNLKKDYQLFNEYHALIVKHAKNYYGRMPYSNDCPLKKLLQ